jgi:branched-chain amino acid transport system substrate-binding protein
MQVVSEAGLVLVSGSSSSPSLTSVAGQPGSDWQPGFYRTAQNDASVGRAAATYALDELGLTRAATINDGDPYTRGLTDTFEQAFTELGGQVVLATAVNKGDTEMGPVLAAVAASDAELLFLPVFRMEGDYLVIQARETAELENVTLMTAEGLYFEDFISTVGQAGRGMYFVTPAKPEGPEYQSFVSRYEENYGAAPGDTPYHAHAYDATNLLLSAIQTVAVEEADGTLQVGRQALRDALYATSGYEGLTGKLICDGYGDCGAMRLQVVRLDDPAAGYDGLGANVIYRYPP